MRALVLFNVDFAAWPVHILAALQRRVPGLTADAVVVVDKTVTSWLHEQSLFAFDRIHCLAELEPGWIGDDPSLTIHYPSVRGCWPRISGVEEELNL